MADTAEGRKVHFPKVGERHWRRVKETLGPLVAVANPLDYHTFIWNNEPAMTATFTAMVSGGYDFNLLVIDFPRSDRCSDADWWATINAFEAALKANGAKGGIVASLPENLPEEYCAGLIKRGHRAALRHSRGDGRGGGGSGDWRGVATACHSRLAGEVASQSAAKRAGWAYRRQGTRSPDPSPQGGGVTLRCHPRRSLRQGHAGEPPAFPCRPAAELSPSMRRSQPPPRSAFPSR